MLSESEIVSLFALLEVEGPFSKVAASFRAVCKRRGSAAAWAKQGLHDLENTISHAQALGIKVCSLTNHESEHVYCFDNIVQNLTLLSTFPVFFSVQYWLAQFLSAILLYILV